MKRVAAALMLSLGFASCAASEPQVGTLERQTAVPVHKPDVRYDPSPYPVVQAMLEMAKVGPNDIVYDLGSGDGRIPIAAARDFGAKAVGVEIDPKLIARAEANALQAGVDDRVTFRNEDLFKADFHDATVVTLFLLPAANLKLRPRLLTELQPGTRVVSHYHDMGDWKPERTVRMMGRSIYLWTIPPR